MEALLLLLLQMHHMGSLCSSTYPFPLHRCQELQHFLFVEWDRAACVHLQGEKERFNEIKQELSQISTKFSNNLLVSCISVAAHLLSGVP